MRFLMRSSPLHSKSLLSSIAGVGASLLLACAEPAPEVPPRQISSSPFHYPEELWDAGVEGETILELHLSDTGAVDSANVETTSGYPAFDSAAVAGADDLEFEPARRGDETVAVRVLLPVQFHLPDADSLAAADSVPS